MMAKDTHTTRLLSDLLRSDDTLKPVQVEFVMRQLLDQVGRLHRAQQLHRNIAAATVRLDQQDVALLQPASQDAVCFGVIVGIENLPPELDALDELRLPLQLESAAKAIWEAGAKCDARRVDIFQLGSLAIELLAGASVSNYLIDPETKSSVPADWCKWIDTALGFNSTDRADRCETLLLRLKEFSQASDFQNTATTPPLGTGIDVERDTPGFGNALSDNLVTKTALPFAYLGDYRIDSKLGSGGMGDVYCGYDKRLDRSVAIKVLPPELARHPDFVDRFTSEARAAAKLVHPNIVPIYFIGQDAGQHFFVMEHVAGLSLAQLLKRRRKLSLDQTFRLTEQVVSGLAEAHENGLIHRDIKPGNILIEQKSGKAKLADFGLVKSLGSSIQATATGVVMGTVDYIAPEQGRGHSVDGRADLYSIGVLMYQLLSGKLPFSADSPTAMIFQHTYEQPTRLSEAASDVPLTVEALVERLMQKDPNDRYQSAQALIEDLQIVRAGGEPKFTSIEPGSSSRGSSIIFAPAVETDFPDDPDAGLKAACIPMVDQGWRTRVLAGFNRHAPEILKDLQNTQQQVDGAVAVYTGRRNELAALVQEAEAMEREFSAQIAEQQAAAVTVGRQAAETADSAAADAARRQQSLHQKTATELMTQLNQQKEQTEQISLRLAKVDTTLNKIRSQRQLLLARLETARARETVAVSGKPARRSRLLTPMTVVVAGLFVGGLLVVASLVPWHRSAKQTAVVAPVAGEVAARSLVRSPTIRKLNSASAAFGRTRSSDNSGNYQILDFDVSGSDKLVVSLAMEFIGEFDIRITYAGHELTRAVQLQGNTTAGIYYLDQPNDVASRGTVAVDLDGKRANGVGLYAAALAGTAPGSDNTSTGKLGNPFASLNVTSANSYVLAAAASDDLSTKVPSGSPRSAVSVEAPFVEVGEFNGVGNEIGSALAATADLVVDTARDYTVCFTGLSDRRNRESVVLAAFAPASVNPDITFTDSIKRMDIHGPDGWFDMLPIINLDRDAVGDSWRHGSHRVMVRPMSAPEPLTVPIILEQSYNLALTYQPGSNNHVQLAFPIGTAYSVLQLGYRDGNGIALGGERGFTNDEARQLTARSDFPLLSGQSHKIELGVTLNSGIAEVTVTADGLKLFDWRGLREEILLPKDVAPHPLGSVPTLTAGGTGDVLFTELAVEIQHGCIAKLLRQPFLQMPPATSGHVFALNFEGKSRHVTVAKPFRVDPAEPMTFEAWLKPRQQAGNNRAIVLRDRAADKADSRIQLAVTDKAWEFRVYDPLTDKLYRLRSPEPVEWNKWVHVAGVYKVNQLELYVDGKRVSVSPEFTPPKFQSTLLRIGAKTMGQPVFQGQISQVRISSYARYQADFAPEKSFSNDDRVMVLYHLDEGVGNLTYDASGNGYHGKIRYPRWVKLTHL